MLPLQRARSLRFADIRLGDDSFDSGSFVSQLDPPNLCSEISVARSERDARKRNSGIENCGTFLAEERGAQEQRKCSCKVT